MLVKLGSLTLREEHRLRVFENRVLRRIFGPKRDEVRGGWRKLHDEKLNKLYPSPSVIIMSKSRRMRWIGHVALMGRRGKHIGHWWESQKERPLGRLRHRWVDNIKIDIRHVGWGGIDWIDLTQDRDQWQALVNTEMNLQLT
jgi:hypothetical protein